ncbi:MAG: porin [Gammaproteobacteria bacterium]
MGSKYKTRSHVRLLQTASFAAVLAAPFSNAFADGPAVSVGAGVRTSFTDVSYENNAAPDVDDFNLDSARIYISGTVTDNIKVMFNTEYNGSTENVQVIDAAAMITLSDQINIWAGRFLPPSDRANLYGPYYANNWGVYQDGVQDGYPSEAVGREDGVMYWGQFGIAKLSFGAFDIQGLTKGSSEVLYAARAQFDFWDKEDGYYLNGTYYGDKDLLALGFAGQSAGSDKAYSVDFLLEKKLGNAGAFSIESEYAKYDGLGGYSGPKSDGWYILSSYLFPQPVGIGKFQLLGKYGQATYDFIGGDVEQKTSEVDLNYVLKQFNARISIFYIDTKFDDATPDKKQFGLGLQVQL